MKPERPTQFQGEDAVPLRGTEAARQIPAERVGAEEPVPLRPAFDRVEAEERAERLRLVTGCHRSRFLRRLH